MIPRKILFVAEAGTEIGLGSLSRCVHLSNEILKKDAGISVSILTNSPLGEKYLKKSGANAKCLFYETTGLCDKLREACDEETLLVATEDRLVNACDHLKFKKLIIIGDATSVCSYPIDLFISSLRVSSPKVDYIKTSFVGPEYHFVHMDQELVKKYAFREHVESALVSMGGADYRDLTVSVSGALFSKLSAKISVVIGPCTHRVGFVEKRISGISDSIEIRRKHQSLAENMEQFDLAVTKPGVTCYELLSIGVPVVLISTNDQHKEISQFLADSGAVLYLGHWDVINQKVLEEQVHWLACNPEKRRQMSLSAKKLIDGNGLDRVLEKIYSI